MNSIWLKIAGVAVVVVLVIVVLGRFGGDRSAPPPAPQAEPVQKDKTFYDMVDRDKQFQQEPELVTEPVPEQPQEPAPQPPVGPVQPAPQAPAPPPQTSGVILPSSITQPTTLHFKPLEEMEDIQAQQLLPWVTTGRSIGRLPMMQYGLMVKGARQILERWPDSWYAFRAKQMLEEISERYAANYKITPQELDISRFMKPRRGTEPRSVEPVRR